MKKLLLILALLSPLLHSQSQINSFQILRLGKQSTAPANPPINASYVYFDGVNVVCVTSSGASCLASSGGSGTVTNIATTSPIGGGTITGTGTLTCTTCLTATSPTNHGILIGAGSQAVGATTAGTSGQVLTSNGASADPTFQAAAGGAVVQLETHAASNSASLNFTTCLGTAGYSRFRVEVLNLRPATNGTRLELLFSTNGGSSYDSSGIYGYSSFRTNSGGTAVGGASSQTQAIIDDGSTTDNTANFGINATYSITPGGATAYTRMQSLSYSVEGSGAFFEIGLSHALYASNTATNAFKIFFDSGNITTGTINCYGITP